MTHSSLTFEHHLPILSVSSHLNPNSASLRKPIDRAVKTFSLLLIPEQQDVSFQKPRAIRRTAVSICKKMSSEMPVFSGAHGWGGYPGSGLSPNTLVL